LTCIDGVEGRERRGLPSSFNVALRIAENVNMTGNSTNGLQEQLEAAIDATGVTGASLAIWDGTALHTAVAGVRNSVTGDPMTVDTVMHIGSITKVMNTVLLMQLVDEGRIALEDPVVKHLPELRLSDQEAPKKIGCCMLVNHTSGINGEWLPEYGPDRERIVDSMERCVELDQLHAPGEATSYCNMATVIAGYLTQKLRGVSWYTLMKTRIYEPLEMRHALVDPLDTPRFRCSVGDLTNPKTAKMVQTTRPFLAPSFAPAGSTQMTSAADLVTFARAQLNGGVGLNGVRILSERSAARMVEPTTAFVSPAWQMGLGWMILPGGVLSHGGSGPGVYSQLYAHPASGRVLALLTNCDRGAALEPIIVAPILESWTGIKGSTSKRLSGPVNTKPYEGAYENNLRRVDVFTCDGSLSLRMTAKMDLVDNDTNRGDPPPSVALHALGDDVFEAVRLPGTPPAEYRFVQPDSNGRMRFLATGLRLLVRTQ